MGIEMMIFRRLALLVLLGIFSSNFAQLPAFNFQKLGSEDGLNNTNIFSICQHPDGRMFFTTQNGIYQYNGYSFSKMPTDSVPSNGLLTLSFNKEKMFLSVRNEGLLPFDLKTNTVTKSEIIAIKDNNADCIEFNGRFVYLLTTGIKLNVFDLQLKKLIADSIKSTQKMNQAFCLLKTKRGQCFVGRSDGLYELKGSAQIRVTNFPKVTVHSMAESASGALVLGTNSKIMTWDGKKISSEFTPAYKTRSATFDIGGGKSVNLTGVDRFGNSWFTSTPDDALYLQSNGLTYDVFSLLDIPPTLIRCLFIDRDQNIWVGTYSDGAYCIQNTIFKNLSFYFNNKILNIHQSFLKGNLLAVATANGLYGYNLVNHTTKIISKPDDTFQEPVFAVNAINDVFYYTKYSSLYVSPAVFSGSTKNFIFKPVIGKLHLPVTDSWAILADRELNILRTNVDGTKTKDTLISFSDYRLSVNALLLHDSILYVGTSSGLYTYDFASKKQEHPTYAALNVHINDLALINGEVFAAHESGLTNISKNTLIQTIGEFQLNSVRKIRWIKNKIWLATIDGLYICDPLFKPENLIDKSKGLLSSTVNDVSVDSLNVVVSTIRGIAMAPLNLFLNAKNAELTPKLSISSIEVGGMPLWSENNIYPLSADQENVTVTLNSPIFSKPLRQFFKYRIDGGEWESISNSTYFNVGFAGGTHTLYINASYDNITFSDPIAVVFKKEEKLSEKRSWLLLLSLLALLIVTTFSVIWIRRVKLKARRRLEQEQQMNLLKHQAMNALLSPHFIFNSLTSIQNYINTNNSLKASEYLAKFSRLIRMIIEKAAQSEITLHDELARLTYYLELEKERFKNKFDYFIEIDERIDTHTISVPNMIIQPHVENCIIHGILPKHQHGELHVKFQLSGSNTLLIVIEDNGVGLIKAKEHAKTGHKSLGTSTISSILEINSRLKGRRQSVSMLDKSTLEPHLTGTIIKIEIEL